MLIKLNLGQKPIFCIASLFIMIHKITNPWPLYEKIGDYES